MKKLILIIILLLFSSCAYNNYAPLVIHREIEPLPVASHAYHHIYEFGIELHFKF